MGYPDINVVAVTRMQILTMRCQRFINYYIAQHCKRTTEPQMQK
jgi:hypothetical protein